MWNATVCLIFSALLCCSLVHGAATTSTNSSSSGAGEDSSSSTIDGQLQPHQLAPTTDVEDEIVETLNKQASDSDSESQAPPPPADFKPSYLLSQYSSPDPSPVEIKRNKSSSSLKPSPRILQHRQVSFSPLKYPGIVRKFDNEIKSSILSGGGGGGGGKTGGSSPSSSASSSSPSSSSASVLKLFSGGNHGDGEQGDRKKHSTNTSTLLVHPILDSSIQEDDEIHKNPTLYYGDLQRAPNSYLGGIGVGAARGAEEDHHHHHHQPHHSNSQHQPQHSEPHALPQHNHHHHEHEHHHQNSLVQPKEPHHHDPHEQPNMYYPKNLLASSHHNHGKHGQHGQHGQHGHQSHHPVGHAYESPNHGHGDNFGEGHHHLHQQHGHHGHQAHHHVDEHAHHPQHHHVPHHPHSHGIHHSGHFSIGAHSDYRGHSHGHNHIGPVIGKALQILIPSALLLTGASALFPNRVHVPTNEKEKVNEHRHKRSVAQYETQESRYAIPSALLKPEHRANEEEGGVELFEGDYDEEHHHEDEHHAHEDAHEGTYGERHSDTNTNENVQMKSNTNINSNANMKPTTKNGGSKKKNSFDIDASDEPDFNSEVTAIEEDADAEAHTDAGVNTPTVPEFKPMPHSNLFSKPTRVKVRVPVLRVKNIPPVFASTAAAAAAAVEASQPQGEESQENGHENSESGEGHDSFNFEDYINSKEKMEPKKLAQEEDVEEHEVEDRGVPVLEEIELPQKRYSQKYGGITQYPAYRKVAHKPIIIRTSAASPTIASTTTTTRTKQQNGPLRLTPQEAMSQILSVSVPTFPTSQPTKTTVASTTTATGKKISPNPTKIKTFKRKIVVKQPEVNDPYYEKPIFRRFSTDRPATVTVTVPTIKQINLLDDVNVDVDENPTRVAPKKSKIFDSSFDKTLIRRGIAGTNFKSDDELINTMRMSVNALEQTGNVTNSALKNSLVTIGKAAAILKGTGISKKNNKVEIDLSPDSPVIGLITNYAGREKESPMCQKRALCELSLRGQSENATKFERFLWNLATLVPQSLSVYYDLEDTFDAVQKRKCHVFKCENPNLDLQEL